MIKPKKPSKKETELETEVRQLNTFLSDARLANDNLLKKLEIVEKSRDSWEQSYHELRAYGRVPVTPPDKIRAAISVTADDIYMIVGALEYMKIGLGKTDLSTHKSRSWDYDRLAHRIDKEYLPLCDKIDMLRSAQKRNEGANESPRRTEPPVEANRGAGTENPGEAPNGPAAR
jgi:hypothetical protein